MSSRKRATATDVLVKKVVMQLDGKEWPLVINNLVLIDVEDLTGLNLLDGLQGILAKPSQKFITAMLYAAMKRGGAPYSYEEVGAMLSFHNMALAAQAVVAACVASMPKPDDEKKAEDPTQAVE